MTLADVAWPIDAGKRLRCNSMLQAVAAHCEVDVFVLFADADPAVSPVPAGLDVWHEVIPATVRAPRQAGWRLVRDRVPWQIAVQDWEHVRRRVAARIAHRSRGADGSGGGGPSSGRGGSGRGGYDFVWFGALDHFSQLAASVPAPRMIVDCDDVETDKLRRFLSLPRERGLPDADRIQRRIELPMWARIQRRAVQAADAVLVCSELDRGRLVAQAATSSQSAQRIISVPNTYPGPDTVVARRPAEPATLVVIANYGTDQNVDAAVFAARQVLPVLRAAIPAARIRLVGRRPDRLSGLVGIDGLDIVGPVDSVADELAAATAALIPIRFGGGTRLKIIEALAYGVPVISTRPGAEGIEALDGTHLLLADTAADIVAATQRLIREPELATNLVQAGRLLYERSYQPQATAAAVGAMLSRLA